MPASLLEQLIEALRVLPGVGQKSAQRMAYHVLERERDGGRRLADALAVAVEKIGHCVRCRDFSESELCATCASASRDAHLLCAVESPADRLAIEQATGYRGLYFVLQGRLSPLDGIGPRELGLDRLAERLAEGEVSELIIATNPTVEGEATAHYLAQLARQNAVRPSRLTHGVPLGGELEYVDRGTLAHAFGSRSEVLQEPGIGNLEYGLGRAKVKRKDGKQNGQRRNHAFAFTILDSPFPIPGPMDTLFDKIIRREIPADIVFEDEQLIAFRDIAPQAPVHVLFVPKTPIATLNDLQPGQAEIVGRLAIAAAEYAKREGFADDGYRIVMNCNENGGQTVFQIHLHLLAGAPLGRFGTARQDR